MIIIHPSFYAVHTSVSQSQKEAMIDLLKQDPNWEESVENAENSLLESYHSYAICQGSSAFRFIFLYIKQAKIHRAEFILEEKSKFWFYKNGTDVRCCDFRQIFQYILQH